MVLNLTEWQQVENCRSEVVIPFLYSAHIMLISHYLVRCAVLHHYRLMVRRISRKVLISLPTNGDNCGRSPISTAIGGVVQQTRVFDQECVFTSVP